MIDSLGRGSLTLSCHVSSSGEVDGRKRGHVRQRREELRCLGFGEGDRPHAPHHRHPPMCGGRVQSSHGPVAHEYEPVFDEFRLVEVHPLVATLEPRRDLVVVIDAGSLEAQLPERPLVHAKERGGHRSIRPSERSPAGAADHRDKLVHQRRRDRHFADAHSVPVVGVVVVVGRPFALSAAEHDQNLSVDGIGDLRDQLVAEAQDLRFGRGAVPLVVLGHDIYQQSALVRVGVPGDQVEDLAIVRPPRCPLTFLRGIPDVLELP